MGSGRLPNDAKTLLLEHQPVHIVIVDTEFPHQGEYLQLSLELFVPTAATSVVTTTANSMLLALSGIDIPDRSVRLGFTSVSAGHDHVCGLRENGTVACWGIDAGGKAMSPEGRFTAVAAGGVFSCALCEDGSPLCWGDTSDFETPTPDGPFVAITTGLGTRVRPGGGQQRRMLGRPVGRRISHSQRRTVPCDRGREASHLRP